MVSPDFVLPGFITLLTFFNVLKSEQILDKQNEDFDFDGLPGVSYEFKVEVNAGDEQCFYQKIAQGARLYVSFEALRGGDRLIDVILRDPNMEILDSQIDQTEGSLEHETTVEGIYTICIDNTASMSRYFYGSKRIYFYMGTYITAEWDKYIEEIEGLHLTVTNFTTSISAVQKSIEQAGEHQLQSRMTVVKDWYLITGINNYISWWSGLHIFITVFTSGFQVYFVRRLFRVPNVTPSLKPRA
ncbi:transmembrane emp24 domain-containing protein 6-like [Mytilus trossulus]|uniref:transmembrane emp24 domain-containing protein 6-like n=1 Tax=Mytilus trossulus TaxID=6551 RepID=UPI003006181E